MSQGGDSQQRQRKSNTGPDALSLAGTAAKTPSGPRNIFPVDDDSENYEEPQRSSTSAIRLNTSSRNLPNPTPPTTPMQRRQSGTRDLPQTRQNSSRDLPPLRSARNTTTQYGAMPASGAKAKRRTSSAHWLLPVGIGMIAMLILWVFGTFAVAWGQQRYQDVTYGRPRTYQTDALVGHNDSPQHKTHFIAINYNRQAVVTEWMGGDPAKSVVYVVPYYIVGDNSDLTPVTVELRDVTGDTRPDLIIHIHLSTQDQTFVFVNDGKKFRPPLATDKITM